MLSEQKLAMLALDNNLFVDGWQMKDLYKRMINGDKTLGIDLIVENGIPIAVCVIDFVEDAINVFVHENNRKKQYGKNVIEKTLLKYNKQKNEVYGVEGIDGTEKFYKSCGIAYFKEGYFSMNVEEVEKFIKKELSSSDIRKKRIQEYLFLHGLV